MNILFYGNVLLYNEQTTKLPGIGRIKVKFNNPDNCNDGVELIFLDKSHLVKFEMSQDKNIELKLSSDDSNLKSLFIDKDGYHYDSIISVNDILMVNILINDNGTCEVDDEHFLQATIQIISN